MITIEIISVAEYDFPSLKSPGQIATFLISDEVETFQFAKGNISLGADVPVFLDGIKDELWQAAKSQGNVVDLAAKEKLQAPLTTRRWLKNNQAAIDFMGITPAEQKTAIENMSTAGLKTLVWYLVVIVSALVKREFL